jgi:hypothetical protein
VVNPETVVTLLFAFAIVPPFNADHTPVPGEGLFPLNVAVPVLVQQH